MSSKPLLRVGYQLTEGRKNPKVPQWPRRAAVEGFPAAGASTSRSTGIKRKDDRSRR